MAGCTADSVGCTPAGIGAGSRHWDAGIRGDAGDTHLDVVDARACDHVIGVHDRGHEVSARQRELQRHDRRAAERRRKDAAGGGAEPVTQGRAVAQRVAHEGRNAAAQGVAKEVQRVPMRQIRGLLILG